METGETELIHEKCQNDIAGFIGKTFQILHNDQYMKIIQWSTSGKEFIIKDLNKFQQIVLPKYFRHKKMNSFVRQLNMYGFHKSRKDNSKCIFSHPNFIKDREDLLSSIKRKIKNVEYQAKTPSKQTETVAGSKIFEESCGKEFIKQDNKIREETGSFLPGLLQSQNLMNSFLNLNMSLKKISLNFDVIQDKQDDQLSIAENMESDKERKERLPIINPSFFFCSFNQID